MLVLRVLCQFQAALSVLASRRVHISETDLCKVRMDAFTKTKNLSEWTGDGRGFSSNNLKSEVPPPPQNNKKVNTLTSWKRWSGCSPSLAASPVSSLPPAWVWVCCGASRVERASADQPSFFLCLLLLGHPTHTQTHTHTSAGGQRGHKGEG